MVKSGQMIIHSGQSSGMAGVRPRCPGCHEQRCENTAGPVCRSCAASGARRWMVAEDARARAFDVIGPDAPPRATTYRGAKTRATGFSSKIWQRERPRLQACTEASLLTRSLSRASPHVRKIVARSAGKGGEEDGRPSLLQSGEISSGSRMPGTGAGSASFVRSERYRAGGLPTALRNMATNPLAFS